jgi:hypothetical protein
MSSLIQAMIEDEPIGEAALQLARSNPKFGKFLKVRKSFF